MTVTSNLIKRFTYYNISSPKCKYISFSQFYNTFTGGKVISKRYYQEVLKTSSRDWCKRYKYIAVYRKYIYLFVRLFIYLFIYLE